MTTTETPTWSVIAGLPRREVLALATADIPSTPGVYVWFRDGEPVFLGVADGEGGLRQDIRNHLATGADLRPSVLRSSVALGELGVTWNTVQLQPSVFTEDQVAVVNDWIRACQVTWIGCETPQRADELERELLARHRPLLNQREPSHR